MDINSMTSEVMLELLKKAGYVAADGKPITLLGYATELDTSVPMTHSHPLVIANGAPGFMAGSDKAKLDGLTNYVHPASHPASMIITDANNRFVTDAEKTTWNAGTGSSAVVTTTTNGLMIAADKVKLDGVATGANNYVHPANHPPAIITQDVSNRFVSDAEKTTWNGKASTSVVTTGANGLMIAADKSKLDGIAAGATNYTHPTTHPPSIIAQDVNNRFVTDSEKANWNSVVSPAPVTTTTNGVMIAADKVKLDGIAPGATNYVHPVNHPPSIIAQDASNRFVTDAEKSTWSASGFPVTTTTNGVMIAADKVKLDGIAAGATNYVHPANHPPSIITQDASNRFVTDAEKTTWNAGGSPVTTTTNGVMIAADKVKLDGIAAGAEVNQNTFSTVAVTGQANILADQKTDTLNIAGGTGITISTDAATDTLTITATGSTTPGAHAASHLTGGSDPISVATTSIDGLMTAADKLKLIGIAAGATNYVHPANHVPSIIIQDASNRFVTDAEKTTWNGKASTAQVTTSTDGLMIAADKLKLDGVAAGATNYVHPANHPPSIITQDANNRFVTDAEKATWNSGGTPPPVTTTTDGLMIAADKVKLDGVAVGANNYVHPATHPPSIITQDASNRFVSDAEKTTWNGKASTAVVTTSVDGLMISTDKTKLDGIAVGATNYVHPANHPPSIIVQDANNRFVTDAQITTWNSGGTPPVVTTTTDGLMISTDKAKLDGIQAGANNYVHPANHPASIITQDATNRFVTDTQITTWNGKLDSSAYTATDILTKLKTVDGAGSGLDSERINGIKISVIATAPVAPAIGDLWIDTSV